MVKPKRALETYSTILDDPAIEDTLAIQTGTSFSKLDYKFYGR